MSLDKAIEYGKEHRKQYYGAKAVDAQCRCNGTCLYCRRSRLRHYRKADINYKEQLLDEPSVQKKLTVFFF